MDALIEDEEMKDRVKVKKYVENLYLCSWCPAYVSIQGEEGKSIGVCHRMGRILTLDYEREAFPEWCPLEDVGTISESKD